jgi:hypothetical protein
MATASKFQKEGQQVRNKFKKLFGNACAQLFLKMIYGAI